MGFISDEFPDQGRTRTLYQECSNSPGFVATMPRRAWTHTLYHRRTILDLGLQLTLQFSLVLVLLHGSFYDVEAPHNFRWYHRPQYNANMVFNSVYKAVPGVHGWMSFYPPKFGMLTCSKSGPAKYYHNYKNIIFQGSYNIIKLTFTQLLDILVLAGLLLSLFFKPIKPSSVEERDDCPRTDYFHRLSS